MFNNIGAPPYTWQGENQYIAEYSPSTVHSSNTGLCNYYKKYLLQRAVSIFKWTVPDTWALNYMEYCLFCWGSFVVLETDKFGVIPQAGALKGRNVQYQPRTVLVTNPLFKSPIEATIGKNCEIVKLQPDYTGILDIINYYADLLALCSETIAVNLLNSRVAYVFFANDEAAAQTYKKMYDKVTSGDPAIVVSKKLFEDDGVKKWEMFNNDVKGNYLVADLLEDMKKIEMKFNTIIGIPNGNIEKKERLIGAEVQANNTETQCIAEGWFESIQTGVKKVNDMFGINLKCEKRYAGSNENDVESIDYNTRSIRI